MAYLEQEIDLSQVEPATSRELLPPGWQKAEVVESEVKPTKKAASAIEYNETGHPNYNDKSLSLTFKILEGEHKGRNVWGAYNYINASTTAQEIARKEVAAIRQAMGIPREKPFRDSDELHNRPIMVLLDVEKSEGYNPRNVIKGYKPADGTAAAVAAPHPGEAKAAPAQPAWNRK